MTGGGTGGHFGGSGVTANDGASVGSFVICRRTVGEAVTGAMVGPSVVGAIVGLCVELMVGLCVGASIVGAKLGLADGSPGAKGQTNCGGGPRSVYQTTIEHAL